jgi:hypothetical protein
MPKVKSVSRTAQLLRHHPYIDSSSSAISSSNITMETTRSIKIMSTKPEISYNSTPSQGTPQACLASLAQFCYEIIFSCVTEHQAQFSDLWNQFIIENNNKLYFFFETKTQIRGNFVARGERGRVDPEIQIIKLFNASNNKVNLTTWVPSLLTNKLFDRDWQFPNIPDKTVLIALIEAVIFISSKLPAADKELLIITAFSKTLPKGVSDISQYHALLQLAEQNYIYNSSNPVIQPIVLIGEPTPEHLQNIINILSKPSEFHQLIYNGIVLTNIVDIMKRRSDIFGEICSQLLSAEYIGVSSDQMACASFTFPAKIYNYNFQLLCTRKVGGNTANIVLQKNLMGFIACIIGNSYEYMILQLPIDNEHYIKYKQILESIRLIKKYFLEMEEVEIESNMNLFVDRCFLLTDEINEKYNLLHPYNTFIPLCTKLNELNNHYFVDFPYIQFKFEQFAILIKLLVYIIGNPENLIVLQYLSSRWIHPLTSLPYGYSLSCTILKIIMPFQPLIGNDIQRLKTAVMVGSVYDIKNGHDFQLAPIKNLGNQFLNYMTGTDNIRLINIDGRASQQEVLELDITTNLYRNGSEEVPYIREFLRQNGYITMGQVGPNFYYIFNPSDNLLKADAETMYLSSINYSNLFRSLLSTSDIIIAIDLTSGVQPFSHQKNILHNSRTFALEHHHPTSFNDSYYIYKSALITFFKSIQYYELLSTAAYFDGAALYGLFPMRQIPTLILEVKFTLDMTLKLTTKTTNMHLTQHDKANFESKLPNTFKEFMSKLEADGLTDLIEYMQSTNMEVKIFNNLWLQKFKQNNSINKHTYIDIFEKISELINSHSVGEGINKILNRTDTLGSEDLIHSLKKFNKVAGTGPSFTVPGYYFPSFYQIIVRILKSLEEEDSLNTLLIFSHILEVPLINPTVTWRDNYILEFDLVTIEDKEQSPTDNQIDDRKRREVIIQNGLLNTNPGDSRFAIRSSLALGLKSHKKNKLKRRRTYKRGKEEHFLPTPTKTHKRRHIKTPLERLRAKLQPKTTRRRRTRA